MVDIIRAGATNDEVLKAVSCCLNQDPNHIQLLDEDHDQDQNLTPNLVDDLLLPDMTFDIIDESAEGWGIGDSQDLGPGEKDLDS